ncbi:MAG: aminotransferase class III-fold pyridoxal phosphate-dependent enzyme, partial [Neisseriaceae bacterium]
MNSQQIFDNAKQYIPGGVNSPVRSFNSVGGTPFFTKKAKGCYLYDSQDKQYIDYVCSWGANIVGHANPQVIEAVAKALENGFSYGTPTELEVEFAKQICQ